MVSKRSLMTAVGGVALAFVAPIACMFSIPELVTPTGDAGDAGGEAGARGKFVPDPSCPSNGGPMARVGADGISFCIDQHEVTVADYAAYLDASAGDAAGQIARCSWNTGIVPDGWPPNADPQEPVRAVNWCDAHLYCVRMGKRLCGAVGGGTLAAGDRTKPSRAEWYHACTKNGSRAYPYGNDVAAGSCVLGETKFGVVGSSETCQGGYDRIYDMLGNVAEWEDSCEPKPGDGSDDDCALRGLARNDKTAECASPDGTSRVDRNGRHGIRCCAN